MSRTAAHKRSRPLAQAAGDPPSGELPPIFAYLPLQVDRLVNERAGICTALVKDADGVIIARVLATDRETVRRRARLFAAAPGLFEAIEAWLEYWDSPRDGDELGTGEEQRLIDAMRAELARAARARGDAQ